ncbi:MAG: helix-turn-helix domain-containing protein [Lachnospiraceae bacterium]
MSTHNYFEKLNFENGKKINISTSIDKGLSEVMHWHPFIEILISLKDTNEVTINFTTYVLKANDLIIIYSGDLHSLSYEKDEDAFILVQFPPELLLIMSEFNANFSIFHQYHFIKYEPSNIAIDRMSLLIKELPGLYYSEIPFKEVRMYSILLEFFIKFNQYCVNAKNEEFSTETNAEPKFIKLMTEACLYISQNCTNSLTLDDISSYVGFSKFHFSRLFKTYTDMTFTDFLTTERIKKAELMISNPKTPIIDIAFNSGFSNVSSFNRAFKKQKGVSPSQFRKMIGAIQSDS